MEFNHGSILQNTANHKPYSLEQKGYHDMRASSTHLEPNSRAWHHEQLISPPPAFRSSEPALNKLPINVMPPPLKYKPQNPEQADTHPSNRDTQLTTRLTRTKRQPMGKDGLNRSTQQQQGQHRCTTTKFEQSIMAPELRGKDQSQGKVEIQSGKEQFNDQQVKGCRFKAQVLFESDTDSMSVSERQSGASQSSRCSSSNANNYKSSNSKRLRKEIFSETKYSRRDFSNGPNPINQAPEVGQKQLTRQQSVNPLMAGRDPAGTAYDATKIAQSTNKRMIRSSDFLEPSWDYSLRVNRMHGNKVDSKVK